MTTPFQSGPYDFRRGCAFTTVAAGAATNPSYPTGFYGSHAESGAGTNIYAGNIVGRTSVGVNIFGFTVTSTDATARTLEISAVNSSDDEYVDNTYTLTVKASAAPGDYYPIGGPNGLFLRGNGHGGGFAFLTSNALLLGTLWWEPCGSF